MVGHFWRNKVSDNSRQRKKLPKRDQLTPDQMAQALHAKKSYWPFALSCAVLISMVGVVTHPIVLGIGIALAIVAIIGWGLEYH
jgi:Cytochrome c oxidase subunit IV